MVSLKDPKVLRESEATIQLHKTMVAEPRGARAKIPADQADDAAPATVDVTHSFDATAKKDIYVIVISVGGKKVHTIQGKWPFRIGLCAVKTL